MQENTSPPAHSCVHCVDIVLPGNPEEILVSPRGSPEDPLHDMEFEDRKCNRLGLSLADLRLRAHAGCDFSKYLRDRVEGNVYTNVVPNAVQLYTRFFEGSVVFYSLICLQSLHPSGSASDGSDLSRCFVYAARRDDWPDIWAYLTTTSGKSPVHYCMMRHPEFVKKTVLT